MMVEMTRLVVVIEMMAAGSVSQPRKPTSTMKEAIQNPISTPRSGSRLKYATLATMPPRRAAPSSPSAVPTWNNAWME